MGNILFISIFSSTLALIGMFVSVSLFCLYNSLIKDGDDINQALIDYQSVYEAHKKLMNKAESSNEVR